MSFLAAVGTKILEWILAKVWALVEAAVRLYLKNKKIDEESRESVEPLEKAKTGDEIDKASDPALGGW